MGGEGERVRVNSSQELYSVSPHSRLIRTERPEQASCDFGVMMLISNMLDVSMLKITGSKRYSKSHF